MRCSSNIAEVCGSDGITYSNACLMLGESCRAGKPYVVKVSDGKCKSNWKSTFLVSSLKKKHLLIIGICDMNNNIFLTFEIVWTIQYTTYNDKKNYL